MNMRGCAPEHNQLSQHVAKLHHSHLYSACTRLAHVPAGNLKPGTAGPRDPEMYNIVM